MTEVRHADKSVHLLGTVFFDLVFSELSRPPRPGTEVRTTGLNISPGGIANIAVAFARLGLRVGLTAEFSDDAFGQYLWSTLSQEGIDLSTSRLVRGWTTPVTVSMASGKDRSMVTHQEPLLPEQQAEWPAVRADAVVVSLGAADPQWLRAAAENDAIVVADVGWDHEERWSNDLLDQLELVDVFLPNESEALAYSRQTEVKAAAAELGRRVPLVVIKRGAGGALAYERSGARLVTEPGLKVQALDSTGAGDVFDAGFLFATLEGWDLEERLRFANLCAAESVCLRGSSLSSPCWRDLRAWWEATQSAPLRRRYAFLKPYLETAPERGTCRRAQQSLSLEQALSAALDRRPAEPISS
jgi:sugar/nucleoside kinase (ribokinase family)